MNTLLHSIFSASVASVFRFDGELFEITLFEEGRVFYRSMNSGVLTSTDKSLMVEIIKGSVFHFDDVFSRHLHAQPWIRFQNRR